MIVYATNPVGVLQIVVQLIMQVRVNKLSKGKVHWECCHSQMRTQLVVTEKVPVAIVLVQN